MYRNRGQFLSRSQNLPALRLEQLQGYGIDGDGIPANQEPLVIPDIPPAEMVRTATVELGRETGL